MIFVKSKRQLSEYNGNTVMIAEIECDTVSDLNDIATYFSGITLIPPTNAHIIADNTIYAIQGDGTWVIQEDPLFSGIYTKSQIDDMFSDVDDIQTAQAAEILSLQRNQQGTWNLLMDAYNGYTKNLLNVFEASSGQTATINGITWAVQPDGTVTANGTASANSFFYIIAANTYKVFGVPTIMTGCPPGGSSTTYEMQTAIGSDVQHDYGDSDGVYMGATTPYRYVILTVRQGYVANNLTFKPMICDQDKFGLNSGFVAWTPSLPQLYQMVRALQ